MTSTKPYTVVFRRRGDAGPWHEYSRHPDWASARDRMAEVSPRYPDWDWRIIRDDRQWRQGGRAATPSGK